MTRREMTALDGTVYAPGARFLVVRVGARLEGWVPVPGAVGGWDQSLSVGDTLTCTGFGPGMGADPGYGVEFTSAESEAASAFHCDFRPSVGGTWRYHPAPGYLEPITENTDQHGGTS
jgi:hypothetical protein